MTQKMISYRGTDIAYTVTGKGAPVVLLHGFGEDSTIWYKQASHLKEKYTLILPDIPGSGRSTLVPGETNGLEDYASCIKAVVQAEGISNFILIGHSMGGYITLAYQEKYPGDLTAFGLFHSSAYADDPAKIETRKKAIEFVKMNGVEAFLKTSIPGLFKDAEKSTPDIETLLQKGKLFSSTAIIQYYHAMINRPDRTSVLKNARIPVLLVAGAFDKAIPFEHSLQQSHLPEQTYFNILRNSAHMGMLEETSNSNEILAYFLQNHSSEKAIADSIFR